MATRVTRRVILGFNELMCVIDGALAENADPVVVGVMDTDHIVISLLQEYFNGVSHIDVEETFDALKLPRDIRTQVIEETRFRLYNHIQTAFRYVYPSRNYDLAIRGRTIVISELIEELEHAKATPEHPDTARDFDGWIPERQRHS